MWAAPILTALAFVPALISAAVFPKGGLVKEIDAQGFKKIMKGNRTSVVAFVAPWCGHCQKMAPEYSKAAKGLDPLIPLYAVDCDVEANKPLCGAQGVKGFPTVKLFPRGGKAPPVDYDSGERTSKNFYYWATRKVPNVISALKAPAGISPWLSKHTDRPRALLLHKDAKVPLLWTVLGNALRAIPFAALPDPDGAHAKSLGLTSEATSASRVVLYAPGSDTPILYDGVLKFEPLSKYLKGVVDGTVELGLKKTEEAAEPEAEARPKDEL